MNRPNGLRMRYRPSSAQLPRLLALGLLSSLFLTTAAAAGEDLPGLEQTCVNDHAGLIGAKDKAAIRSLCEKAERGGVQMMIVTVASLEAFGTRGPRLEIFVDQLFDEWDIEYDAATDAILLFVSKKEHQIRIRMGENYSDKANQKAQGIMRGTVGPALRRRPSGGIKQGFSRLYHEVATPRIQEKKRKEAEDNRKRGVVNFD